MHLSRLAVRGYRAKAHSILKRADKYHTAFYDAFKRGGAFGGPSVHFHQRALKTRDLPGDQGHLEYVYATLASWGMHRMGKGGPKMHDFDVFRESAEPLAALIREGQSFTPQAMGPQQWENLETIFRRIKVMKSGITLVGNSKAMHHMMPNIVPPIDREYTLRYLQGNKNIARDLDREWQLMREVLSEFFFPIASDAKFEAKAGAWTANPTKYPWDTSLMKVVDNLVIGSQK